MFELDVQRFTRHCAQTGRELQAGETVYSTVALEQGQLVRRDFAAQAWEALAADQPPADILGWWRWTVPDPDRSKVRWAPRDVLLNYFQHLESQPDQQDTRYVLALLLLRRKILRAARSVSGPEGEPRWEMECPSRQTTYMVQVCPPAADRLAAIQQQLHRLLEGGMAD